MPVHPQTVASIVCHKKAALSYYSYPTAIGLWSNMYTPKCSVGGVQGHCGECRTSLPAADSDRRKRGRWYFDVLVWLVRGQLWEPNRDPAMWSMEVCVCLHEQRACASVWSSNTSQVVFSAISIQPQLFHIPLTVRVSFSLFIFFLILHMFPLVLKRGLIRVCMGIITIKLWLSLF